MFAGRRRNASFIETSILWMLFAMEIYGGFAQTEQLNVDGKTFSTFSNVTGNFNTTLDTRFIYEIAWRFNESDICTVPVDPGLILVTALIKCDPASHTSGSDEWYYATNSQIRATLSTSSGVFNLDLVYSMAMSEEYPLRMDVYDNAADRLMSNIVEITVQNCTSGGLVDTTVSESCGFDCTTTANCKLGFDSKAINVTCQANGTWYQPDMCSAISCLAETCDDCCYINGTNLPIGGVELGFDETLEYKCCEGFTPYNRNNFTCTEGGNHSLVPNCEPVICTVEICKNCCSTDGSIPTQYIIERKYNETLDVKCCDGFTGNESFICTKEGNYTIDPCVPVRCPITKCEHCCYTGGTDPTTTVIGYQERVTVACCEYSPSGGTETQSFACTKQGERFDPTLECSPPETSQPTTLSDVYITSGSITIENSTETDIITGYGSREPVPETTQPTTIADAYVTSDSITGGNSTKTGNGMVTEEVSAEPVTVTVTGAIYNNASTDPCMSGGDIAGVTFTCIDVVAGIAVGVLIALGYTLIVPLIITYAVAFPVCLAGILMAFLGSDGGCGSELNGVEIGGIVLASLGNVAAVGGLVFQGVRGKTVRGAEQKYRAKNGTSVEKEPGSQDVYAAVDKSKKTSQATNL